MTTKITILLACSQEGAFDLRAGDNVEVDSALADYLIYRGAAKPYEAPGRPFFDPSLTKPIEQATEPEPKTKKAKKK